jgi:hypothetical protein
LRKRKYLVAAAVAVVALATAVVAIATTQRTYKQDFSTATFKTNDDGTYTTTKGKPTKKPGKPTGSYFIETATDPENTEGNEQPKQDAYVDDFFPKGSKIDQSSAPSCKKTNDEIINSGGKCKGKIGAGKAVLRTQFSSAPDINASLTAFNCEKGCKPPEGSGLGSKHQLIFYVNPGGSNQVVLRGTVSTKDGVPKIHVPIPINCVLGTPPDCGDAGDARIVKFELSIKKYTRKVDGKTKVFLKTPKTCPSSHKWPFKIKFHGRDGKDDILHSKSPCTS